MNHNLFLSWLSESGSGTWSEFREAHEWAFPSVPGQRRNNPYWTAGTYASLGHLEVDNETERWAASPPVITILPGAGEHAVLVGSRTRHLMTLLTEATSESTTQDLMLLSFSQRNAPDAVFIAATSETHLEQLALGLGIGFEHDVGETIASVLRPLETGFTVIASPPNSSQELERWDPANGQWFTPPRQFTEGLYRYRASGVRRYRLFDASGTCYAVDFPTGAYAEVARIGRRVITYESEPVNGTLVVNVRTPLPDLHARAAALCSGIAPQYNPRVGVLRYLNVPRSLGDAICASLRQPPVEAN